MNDPDTDNPSTTEDRPPGSRPVYVLPAEDVEVAQQVTLSELWRVVWNDRWLIVAITAVCALGAVTYALLATEWYRADVLLAPTESPTGQGVLDSRFGGLGGLVGLAGVNSDSGNVEAIAVLRSRDFAKSFIGERNLLPVLFSDRWDSTKDAWSKENTVEIPDLRDGAEYFIENIRRVSQDSETGLVSLSIEWTDAEVAADWAGDLVGRLNRHMRDRALREAEANIKFLQEELSSTSFATLRESIGSLLEAELQKLMLAKGNAEFAFRIVDSAQVPKHRIRPKRALTVVLAVLLGGVLSILIVFVKTAVTNDTV